MSRSMPQRIRLALQPKVARPTVIESAELGILKLQRGPSFLPQKRRRADICLLIHHVRHDEETAGPSPVVVAKENCRENSYHSERNEEATQRQCPRRIASTA